MQIQIYLLLKTVYNPKYFKLKLIYLVEYIFVYYEFKIFLRPMYINSGTEGSVPFANRAQGF